MKNSLETNGLSMSQAQSISNLCNQRSLDIASELGNINNVSKVLTIGRTDYVETVGKPIPVNVVDLILEKSKLHACQAFLMVNIRAKDQLITDLKGGMYTPDYTNHPKRPDYVSSTQIDSVDESWGWEQLTNSEHNEYLEAEAYAAHVGQFIHKNGVLDRLRKELPTIKTLEWMTVKDGEKTPLKVTIHHKQEDLLNTHNQLAATHRKYEQQVNYFKAKVKNLTTSENARIANENASKQSEADAINHELNEKYLVEFKTWEGNNLKKSHEFEAKRQDEIKKIVSLRINIDKRFQETIDTYLKQIEI